MLSRLLSFVKSPKSSPLVDGPQHLDVSNISSTILAPDTGYPTPDSDCTPSPRDSFFTQDAASLKPLDLKNGSLDTIPLPCPILDLPTDVLLVLADQLPTPSLLSLRLTCTSLNNLLPSPARPRDDDICALTACARHLSSLRDAQDARFRCALCKALYPISLFRRAGIISPSLPFANFAAPTIVDGDESALAIATGQTLSQMSDDSCGPVPDARICAWHINRFVFPPTAALAPDAAFDALVSAAGKLGATVAAGTGLVPFMDNAIEGGWASSVESCCMHCGCVVVCVCAVGGCGVCACDCDGCGVREVRCWWKLGRSGYRPTHEASFRVARAKWLIARADESEKFGWDGRKLRAEKLLDWGMVRVVKCVTADRRDLVAGSRKRKAEDV